MREKISVYGEELKAALCEVCPGHAKIFPASDLPLHHAMKHPDVAIKPRRRSRGGRTMGKEPPGRRMSSTGVEKQEGIKAA